MRQAGMFHQWCFAFLLYGVAVGAQAENRQQVVDIPTRSNVTQRFLLMEPATPKAVVILFAGGHGGLQINESGGFGWGGGNFLVRSRELFVNEKLVTVVIDVPSDRQSNPFLADFRQTPRHAADVKAVIAWLREKYKLPVWLVGTSRGTQSAGYLVTALSRAEGPDGVVLTSTILSDKKTVAVPEMPLEKIQVPVLVVHHEKDGCNKCLFRDMPDLMKKLNGLARKELVTFTDGADKGDPCEARAYHGFNGIEHKVVRRIADWVLAPTVHAAK